MRSDEDRILDLVQADQELRRLWLALGVSPEIVERAIAIKNRPRPALNEHVRDNPQPQLP